jgi:hypothetical protein
LLSFSATAAQTCDAIVVRWVTGAEINTFGFNLLRSTGPRVAAAQVNAQIIAGKGSGGGAYQFADTAVRQWQRYNYWLQEVETSGKLNEHGPVTGFVVCNGLKVFLPLVTR